MKKRINSLEDLKAEKRLLRLEIKATENLIVQSLHLSKDHLVEGAADAFFSLVRRDPGEATDFSNILALSHGEESKWWQRLTPFVPLMLKIAGMFYESKKAKKKLTKRSEMTIHKVAS